MDMVWRHGGYNSININEGYILRNDGGRTKLFNGAMTAENYGETAQINADGSAYMHGSDGTSTLVIANIKDEHSALSPGADRLSMEEDASLNLNAQMGKLLSNDTYAFAGFTANQLSIGGFSGAVNGSLSNNNGNWTFKPTANFYGQAGFSYTVNTPLGGSKLVKVNIDVTPVNDPIKNVSYVYTDVTHNGKIIVDDPDDTQFTYEFVTDYILYPRYEATPTGVLDDNDRMTYTYTKIGDYQEENPSGRGLSVNTNGTFVNESKDRGRGIWRERATIVKVTDSGGSSKNVLIKYNEYATDSRLFPIILDLNNNGIQLQSAKTSTAYFDALGDGWQYQTGWTQAGSGDGILAFDCSLDGKITDLFEIAFKSHKNDARTDLEGLKYFDTNANNQLDAGDAEFYKFRVWVDTNANGITDDGELQTLAAHGITSVNMLGNKNSFNNNGNTIYGTSSAQKNGSSIAVWDASLTINNQLRLKNQDGSYSYKTAVFDQLSNTGGVVQLEGQGAELAPVVIDDANNGLSLSNLDTTQTYFGSVGDGWQYKTAWTTTNSDDAFVTLDRNNNGQVDDIFELSFKDYDPQAKTDLEGLNYFDTNKNGLLDSNDTQFAQFKLWFDSNANGVSDAGELKTFAQAGLTHIKLNVPKTPSLNNGNTIYAQTSSTLHGVNRTAYDVALKISDSIRVRNPDGSYSYTKRMEGTQGQQINGTLGNDDMIGTIGNDIFNTSDGNDKVMDDDGDDMIRTGLGNDTIWSGGGLDAIHAGEGDDIIFAGSGNDIINADSGDDKVLGEQGNDFILLGSGDDFADGSYGDDVINGGSGRDIILGNQGADYIDGEADDDRITGGADNDELYGGTGNDTLDGEDGNDTLHGEDGDDKLYGDAGNDVIVGDFGNDYTNSGTGDDNIYTCSGSDTLVSSVGYDQLYGGRDWDTYTITFEAGMYNSVIEDADSNDNISFTNMRVHEAVIQYIANGDYLSVKHKTIANSELKVYKPFGDGRIHEWHFSDGTIIYADEMRRFYENINRNTFDENANNVTLSWANNYVHDVLFGLAGDDVLSAGEGDDLIFGQEGKDTLYGGNGNDLLFGSQDMDILYGGDGDDILHGGNDNEGDYLYGGAGNDILNGESSSDFLYSSIGYDKLYGGGGWDNYTITFEAGMYNTMLEWFPTDNAVKFTNMSVHQANIQYSSNWGGYLSIKNNSVANSELIIDKIFGQTTINEWYFADGTLMYGREIEKLYAGLNNITLNNTVNNAAGTAQADIIYSLDGSDTVFAGAGDDVVFGQNGDDVLSGDAGNDMLYGGVGADTLNVNDGDDILHGGNDASTDYLNGGNGNDTLFGEMGHDQLYGHDGNDTLYGGHGNDALTGGNGADTYIFNKGDGQDVIYNYDTDPYHTLADTLRFGAGMAANQLWLKKNGNDLEVSVIGTTDKVNIASYYSGDAYKMDIFKSGDGKTLLAADVDKLVQAMAAFAPPSAAQTSLPANYQTTLHPLLAANWK